MLDDERANEESVLFQRRDRLRLTDASVALDEEEGGGAVEKSTREGLSIVGPLRPISAIQADLRGFSLEKVCGGDFSAVLIDPPWSISMALPFPSLRDAEIENLKIDRVLDRSRVCYVFLWATQRKTPLAREILQKWGAIARMRVKTHDLVWVKLNQLNRLVSAGRTGSPLTLL